MMKFQPFQINDEIWYLAITTGTSESINTCMDFSEINVIVTNTHLFWHFDPRISISIFYNLNKFNTPLEEDQLSQFLNAMGEIQDQLEMCISNSNTVELKMKNSILFINYKDFDFQFPLLECPPNKALNVLSQLFQYVLNFAKLQSHLNTVFYAEHSEKKQSIDKLVNKLNTRNDLDPFNNPIVKQVLDISGLNVHLNKAKLDSKSIMQRELTNYNANNNIFNNEMSLYWEKVSIGTPPSKIFDKPIAHSKRSKLPLVPLRGLKCPKKSL